MDRMTDGQNDRMNTYWEEIIRLRDIHLGRPKVKFKLLNTPLKSNDDRVI